MWFLKRFIRDEGQGPIELILLLAFVTLTSSILFLGAGNSVQGSLETTNSQCGEANSGFYSRKFFSRKGGPTIPPGRNETSTLKKTPGELWPGSGSARLDRRSYIIRPAHLFKGVRVLGD
jgi:hypothetical protein